VACDFAAVRAGVTQIGLWLGELDLSETDLGAWELALIEAGNNAVKYTQDAARSLPVVFDVSAGAGDVEARVTDHTPGFDWPEEIHLPSPDAEHGRGLFLMQSLTDEVFYLRHTMQNVLVLRRKRSAGKQLPDAADLHRRLADAESALTEMTAELAANYESLVAIFRYSAELGAQTDLKELSPRLLQDLMQLAEADGAVLRLASVDGKKLETQLILPGSSSAALPPITLTNAGTSAEARAAQTHTDIWFSPQDPLGKDDPLRAAIPSGNGVCHAFFVAGQLVGTVALGRLSAAKPFTAAQVNLVHTLVDFLAIQLVNARLLDERTAARVTRRELQIAAEIQRLLLPAQLPACLPFSLAAACQSATQVGGDLYDAIPVGDGAALLVVADVMGKGVPAALFAAVLRSTIRSLWHLHARPGELLTAVNQILFADLSQVNMFITATLVYVDTKNGQLLSASAGHCPLMFCAMSAETVVPGQPGLPLGIDLKITYHQSIHPFPPGAAALLYTDGLTDTRNSSGELLGESRVRQWFAEAVAQTPDAEETKNSFLQKVAAYRGPAPLTDDQTLVLIRRCP